MAHSEQNYFLQPTEIEAFNNISTEATVAKDCLAKEFLTATKHSSTAVLIISIIVSIVGIAGNGSLVYLFCREKNLRDVNNAFITNLAIGDFFFITVFTPAKIFQHFFFFLPFGKIFCYIQIFAHYCTQDVSMFSLVALSFIRFRVVVFPMHIQTNHHRKLLIRVTCVAIWTVALVSSVLPASRCAEIKVCHFIKVHLVEGFNDTTLELFFTLRFFLVYLIPLVMITFLYSAMAMILWRSSKILQGSVSTNNHSSGRRRLAIVVLVLIAVFAVGWMPNYIALYIEYYTKASVPPFVSNSRFLLSCISSAVNPIILYLTSSTYRSYLRQHVCLHTFRGLKVSRKLQGRPKLRPGL